MDRRRNRYLWLTVLLIIIAGGVYCAQRLIGNSEALWRNVSLECVPHQRQQGQPAPCSEVNIDSDYVIYKDLKGGLQFLLMPIAKISGIESPVLLAEQTPNYFYQSWQARHYLADKRGAAIADRSLSLTVNSELGRTQNHLHVHISCLRPDVRQQIDNDTTRLGNGWQPLPTPLRGHPYLARRVTAQALAAKSPFRMLAEEVPDAGSQMGHYGLALVPASDGSFILLALRRNLMRFNLASTEEIQDHSCAILDTAVNRL
ncbi:CDP-diacylglycerol diphosphatase [Biostraticola tofi]|nr:CDP-diacylglycerol diphosphatase [Biostraticola tofi]